MITFFGIIVLILGVLALFISNNNKDEETKTWKQNITKAQGGALISIGVFLMMINSLFFCLQCQ